MNQTTFKQIINSDQPIEITVELRAAAQESASRERAAAFRSAARWMKNTLVKPISFKPVTPAFRTVITAGIIGSSLIAASHARAEVPVAEIVAQFSERPGAVSITPDGRRLMSLHPLDHPTKKMVEIQADGSETVYPYESFSNGEDSTIKAVLSIRTDEKGVAWVLDFGGNTLYAWDTKNEKLIKTIAIPEDVRVPTSFMQDFALDQKRQRAIIADMTQGDLQSAPTPAFVVVDLQTGDARRIAESHPSMMPEVEGGFALNPITIDPDYEWVYFGALNGHTMYRVPAASFDGMADSVGSNIEAYGPKPFSDGTTIDGSGNVYVNDIENNALGVVTPGQYEILATLPEGQSWPDGNAFGDDGYVYITVNQLAKAAALNDGIDSGEPPYLMVRVKALAAGSTGR